MIVAIRCRTYPQLIAALNARRYQIGMTMIDLDNASGVQEGYSAKIIAQMKTLGKVSTPLMIEALGVELLVAMPPVEAVARTGSCGNVAHDRQLDVRKWSNQP
jgi:hypothetical protein